MYDCKIKKELLIRINKKLKHKKTDEEINNLVKKFCKLSELLDKLYLITNEKKSKKKKINEIKNLYDFNDYQAQEILKKTNLKNIIGGKKPITNMCDLIDELNLKLNLNFIFESILKLPRYFLDILFEFPEIFFESFKKILLIIPNMFCKVNWTEFKDYDKPLGIGYFLLFILASVPYVGAVADFLIIAKALEDGKLFLAIIVSLTTFISFFSGHMFDIGVILKIIYTLDNYSYINYSKKKMLKDTPNALPESNNSNKESSNIN